MSKPIIRSIYEKVRTFIVFRCKEPKNIYLGRIEMDSFIKSYEENNGYRPNTRYDLEFEGIRIIEVNLETHLGVGE